MDYSPELQTYKDQLDAIINDAYMALWTSRPWTFAQKTTFLNVYPDLNYANTTLNASVTDMSRRVTFSSNIRTLAENYIWEGQIFECQGREYRILKVVATNQLRLDEPFRGTTNSNDLTWVIKHRYYDLPQDCVDLLSVSHRDAPFPGAAPGQGKLIPLSQRREEELNLREDDTATWAEGYINISPTNVPPGEKISATTADTGGALPDKNYYEFCWCFVEDGGKLGPLSESIIINTATQVPAGNDNTITLKFISHDDQDVAAAAFADPRDTFPNAWEGKRKRLFFNQNFNRTTGERLGLPLWRTVTKTGTANGGQYDHEPLDTSDETATVTITAVAQVSPGNPRYIETDGQWLRIRPFPRPIGYDKKYSYVAGNGELVDQLEQYFRQLEIRYSYKPKSLCATTDSPELPFDMHQLLVYRTLQDTLVKANNLTLAENYRRLSEKEVKRLEARYMQRKDQAVIRGQFGLTGNRAWYDATSLKHTP
jgi:hypothetical protein